MQIDRESLEKLLSLNDRQLKLIITKLAAESGIDPASFNVNTSDVQSIRRALSSATDSDLARVAQMYEQNRKK
ncbi:MAG: hypothetical protein IJ038_05840 [Clostridia bacterium]|nr:hypothetical protein [Clostridia bacterium]